MTAVSVRNPRAVVQEHAPALIRVVPALAAATLIAGALAMRLAYLGDRLVFRDEAASWVAASLPIPELLRRIAGEPYPPLYALLLKGWMIGFADGPAALRALSVVLGMVTVLAAWRWATEALGRWPGLFVLAICAFAPFAVGESRNVRMYALETAFATVAWWMTWRLVSDEWSARSRRLSAVVLAVCVAGEVWTMSYGIPIALLQLAAAGILAIRRRRPLAPIAIVAGLVSYVPWLPALLGSRATSERFWTPTPTTDGLGSALMGWAGGPANPTSIPSWFTLYWVVGGGVILGLVVLAAQRRVALAILAAAAISLCPAMWLVSQVHAVFDQRYFGSLLAPMAICIAAVSVMAIPRQPAWINWLRGGFGAIIVAATVYSGVSFVSAWRTDPGLAPAPAAMEFVASKMRPGDVVMTPDARSWFLCTYLADRSDNPIRIRGPIYSYHRPQEPFFNGLALLADSDMVDAGLVQREGLRASVPGLAPGGHIWLVALANDADLKDFAPLFDGSVRRLNTWTFLNGSTHGRVVELEPLR